jgi:hypothetical protein
VVSFFPVGDNGAWLNSALVAVLAFKGVVALDLARRQNNKKVIAIQVQMQDMTVVLFECVFGFSTATQQNLFLAGCAISAIRTT